MITVSFILLILNSASIIQILSTKAYNNSRGFYARENIEYAYTNSNTTEKVFCMTYDDGPDPINTPKILDILKRYYSTATFFVMGNKLLSSQVLLQRMLNEKHELGNHMWDHPAVKKLNKQQISEQLNKTQDLLFNLTDFTPTIMRPPYGNTTPDKNRIIDSLGIHHIICAYFYAIMLVYRAYCTYFFQPINRYSYHRYTYDT